MSSTRLLGIPRDLTTEPGTAGVAELPTPVPDHLCQLCEDDLDGHVTDDGLCASCRRVMELQDYQAWVDAGGRTCRRCHNLVPSSGAVDGRCPCGGQLL